MMASFTGPDEVELTHDLESDAENAELTSPLTRTAGATFPHPPVRVADPKGAKRPNFGSTEHTRFRPCNSGAQVHRINSLADLSSSAPPVNAQAAIRAFRTI